MTAYLGTQVRSHFNFVIVTEYVDDLSIGLHVTKLFRGTVRLSSNGSV